MAMSSAFVSFEGSDGCGKTTMVEYLIKLLSSFGYIPLKTREPGGSPMAEEIRRLLFDYKPDPVTEALLFAAGRKDHIEKVIKPALSDSKIVVTDRYYDSSIAYQGIGRKLFPLVQTLHHFALDAFMPDWTIFLDVDQITADERLTARGDDLNRFDQETKDFKERRNLGYEVAQLLAEKRAVFIDASKDIDSVKAQIYDWFVSVFCHHVSLPNDTLTDKSIQQMVAVLTSDSVTTTITQHQKDMSLNYLYWLTNANK